MSGVTATRSAKARLDAVRSEGRAALIGYLPVGYPTVERSCRAIAAMVEAGVDIVEVGLPYSDPSARRANHPGGCRGGAEGAAPASLTSSRESQRPSPRARPPW